MDQVCGDEIPHPAGSLQNEIVRYRIVSLLQDFGYEVEIQSGQASVNPTVRDRSPDRPVVEISNILAHRAGTHSSEARNAILLVAHYDSVPFGPGISDDGVGVAVVLEIARMLASEPAPQRDLIFLLTDGEELGLLGAKLFVDSHPRAADIDVVINLEARGTSGPSLMFQTSENSLALIPIFSRASCRPFTSSLFFEIYRRLPRDTDFTIFKQAGISGYNFAFIGDALNYHSDNDDWKHLDLGSMQHHGDQALGLIRTLADAPNVSKTEERAVYFDLLGWKLFWWPARYSLWISLISILLMAAGLLLTIQRSGEARSLDSQYFVQWIAGCAKVMVAILTVGGVGWMLTVLASFDQQPQPVWTAHPLPLLAGYWLCAVTVLCFMNGSLLAGVSANTSMMSVLMIWSTLAITTAGVFNGGSYLFVVPVLVGGWLTLLFCRFQSSTAWLAMLFPIAVGIIWLPLESLFYDAVGFRMPVLNVVRTALVTSSLIPALRFVDSTTSFYWAIAGSVVTTLLFVVSRFLI